MYRGNAIEKERNEDGDASNLGGSAFTNMQKGDLDDNKSQKTSMHIGSKVDSEMRHIEGQNFGIESGLDGSFAFEKIDKSDDKMSYDKNSSH